MHTRSDGYLLPEVPATAIISDMADKSAGDRPARQRIKSLAQAAMNADVTVEQLEDVLGGLGESLTDLNKSLTHLNTAVDRLNGGLDHFEATLSRIDDLMGRLATLVAPVEAVVQRIDHMMGVGETVLAPLSVTERAVRNAFNALRSRTAR
jgi:ABC-type transporter Mla subunit MlaD